MFNHPTQQFLEPPDNMRSLAHIVLTRFNVRYVNDPSAPSLGTNFDWLTDRFALFERYCWPSLLSQTEQNFTWLLFFDDATPEIFTSRAKELLSKRNDTFPIFSRTLPLDFVQREVAKVIKGTPEWLITTRLDNDDGLHRDFISSIRAHATFTTTEIINVENGLIVRNDRTYKYRHPSNAFISLCEPNNAPKTVFSILRHVEARKHYPTHQVRGKPLWLQVIHASNISNRIRGKRVRNSDFAPGFAPLENLSGQPDERYGAIFLENISAGLLRNVIELTVSLAKPIVKLFGVEIRRTVENRKVTKSN